MNAIKNLKENKLIWFLPRQMSVWQILESNSIACTGS